MLDSWCLGGENEFAMQENFKIRLVTELYVWKALLNDLSWTGQPTGEKVKQKSHFPAASS